MKKIFLAGLFFLFTIGIIFQIVGQTYSVNQIVYVNVQNGVLKASASSLAANQNPPLTFATEVKVLAVSGNWVRVQTTTGNRTGWISSASLTTRKLVAQGNTNGRASCKTRLVLPRLL